MAPPPGSAAPEREVRRRFLALTLLAAPVGAVLALAPLVSEDAGSRVQLAAYTARSPHHAYGAALAQRSLIRNAASNAWVTAAERALLEPQPVTAPFATSGAFGRDAPGAAGFKVRVPAGRRLEVALAVQSAEPTQVFLDVYESVDGRLRPVASAPPEPFTPPEPFRSAPADARRLTVVSLQGGDYVVRVQPELLREAAWDLDVRAAPLLRFPVDGHDARAILSGFGAERDGGARAHRGVDIFAPRGTPALAAMDAWVTRVETTGRGGNVVWLQPLFGNVRLYYAHLDSQLVERGDFVLAGEPVGTVGNTGNARTTPPHLHFGVYVRQRGMRGGARDPWPFLTDSPARR